MPALRGSASVHWLRLGRRAAVGTALVLAAAQLYLQARGNQYGYDFRGGLWQAGHSLLSGRSPFPRADAAWLLRHPNGFIDPPPLALVGAPFSLLPFGLAVVVFNLVCMGGLVAGLRLLGVRSPAAYVLCLCSFPFVSSLALGQPDGLLALAAAVAWRYRDSWPGPVAVGALIAAKLLAWPLVIWLLVTRRFREAILAAGSAVGILLVSWACLGFKGLTSYLSLLSADVSASETRAHSIFTALARSGVSMAAATVLTVLFAVAVASAILLIARGSDLGWFTAALTLGILSSPVVWQHYLVLLLVALAATRRLDDPLVWLLALGLWLSPSETPATLAQAWLIPLLAATMALRIAALSRTPAGAPGRPPKPGRERFRLGRRLVLLAGGEASGR